MRQEMNRYLESEFANYLLIVQVTSLCYQNPVNCPRGYVTYELYLGNVYLGQFLFGNLILSNSTYQQFV